MMGFVSKSIQALVFLLRFTEDETPASSGTAPTTIFFFCFIHLHFGNIVNLEFHNITCSYLSILIGFFVFTIVIIYFASYAEIGDSNLAARGDVPSGEDGDERLLQVAFVNVTVCNQAVRFAGVILHRDI